MNNTYDTKAMPVPGGTGETGMRVTARRVLGALP
jgi:hypothetical protein